jgi:hypothetical protein
MTGVLTVPVPAPMEVRSMLEEMLGRDVQVAPSAPWAPMRPDQGAIGLFVDDSTMIRAVAVCDVELSAYAGASIGLLPVDQAQQAVADNEIPEMLQENLYEVLNIVSALYNVEGAPHLRLYAVHHVGGDATPELLALGGVLGRRLDLTVSIAGYGTGRLGLVGVA